MGYTGVYPPGYNSTYVKATSYYSTSYYPWYAVNPALSLTGTSSGTTWLASGVGSFKLNVDLNTPRTILRIYLENFHNSGAATTYGTRGFSVYGTSSAVAFANTTYADTTNLTLLGTYEARAHIGADTSDPQYFLISSPAAFRYYVIRIHSNCGSGLYTGIRHIEFQIDDGHGEGDLILSPLTISAYGRLGVLSLESITISAFGAGFGGVDIPVISAGGLGGGIGRLYLDDITIAATGRLTIPVSLTSTIPYTIEGGFDVNNKTAVTLSGTIPYVIAGGFQMDRTEIGGTIPYEITGGFDIHSEILIGLSGTIPYTITGGFDVSPHVPVSLVGDIPYTLTGGFAVTSGVSDIDITETIPYTITGGFAINSRAAMEIEGTIPYALIDGFTIESEDSCGGILQYGEDTIC